MTSESMWGNLENLVPVKMPRTYLWEQADALSKGTRSVLRGIVTEPRSSGERFYVTLNIIAPSLNNYEYSVVEVRFPLEGYPLIVEDLATKEEYQCENENEFLELLRKILSSDSIQNIIRSLVSQSKV